MGRMTMRGTTPTMTRGRKAMKGMKTTKGIGNINNRMATARNAKYKAKKQHQPQKW
jgi:hypothetical protein